MRRRVSAISHLTCNWCHKDASHALCLESSSYISGISYLYILQLLVEYWIVHSRNKPPKLADIVYFAWIIYLYLVSLCQSSVGKAPCKALFGRHGRMTSVTDLANHRRSRRRSPSLQSLPGLSLPGRRGETVRWCVQDTCKMQNIIRYNSRFM